MAKKAKKTETSKGTVFEIVNPNAAGIDISNTEMQVCVPRNRDECNNRKFGVYTADLREIAEWLVKCKIDTVAMESTGIYWVGLHKMLLEYGIDVVLADAASVKNYTDRKTDENDAEWLMALHSYGLVRSCHLLENYSRSMRNLYRQRQSLVHDSTQAINRIHKALTQMNIKLSVALSDITGKSGTAVIEAILAGERNPEVLASLTSDRCKKSKEEIAKSLEGTWEDDLLFIVKQEYTRFKFIKSCIVECDVEIETKFNWLINTRQLEAEAEVKRSKKRQANNNARVNFDVELFSCQLWNVNLMRVPGFSAGTILGLFCELGPNFLDKFATCEKFCRWCNLTPNTKISGGKILSSHMSRRYNPVGQIFRTAAGTLHASKDPLGNYYRRLKSKGGPTYAHVATAHKMAKIFYKMVKDKVEYDATKIGPGERELLLRKIERAHREIMRLNKKLNESEAS